MSPIKHALLIATALLPATAASALTETFSGSFGPALTDFGDPTSTIALTGFNSRLGTLTGVALDFHLHGGSSGTVTNTSNTTKFFSVTELVSYGLAYPQASYADSLSAGQTYTLGGRGSGAFGPHALDQTVSLNPTDLTPYKGSSFDVTLSTLTGVTILGGGGNITTAIDTSLAYDAAVTYTYTAAPTVPEPAAWTLMLGGFGLVGAGMRYRAPIAVA